MNEIAKEKIKGRNRVAWRVSKVTACMRTYAGRSFLLLLTGTHLTDTLIGRNDQYSGPGR